jgi:hypothetical protein
VLFEANYVVDHCDPPSDEERAALAAQVAAAAAAVHAPLRASRCGPVAPTMGPHHWDFAWRLDHASAQGVE